jgi:hypothetical protein
MSGQPRGRASRLSRLSLAAAIAFAPVPAAARGAQREPARDAPAAVRPAEPAAGKEQPRAKAAEKEAAARREDDRRKAVEQQARQLEGMLQGPLNAELERVRATGGSLSPEARKEILAAGTQGVKQAALEFAERQFSGKPQKKSFDPRGVIHAAVAKAAAAHLSAEESAAYRREHAAWLERRARAARVLILAKVDRVLDLTADQRRRIEADLVRLWRPEWVRELDDNGGVTISGYKPAPDFAAEAILPHLDERQRGEWGKWCEQAGWKQLQHYFGWPFGGLVMQPDPWWKP